MILRLAIIAITIVFFVRAEAETKRVENPFFFMVSYGGSPSGKLNSEPFSAYGMSNMTATIRYSPTPQIEFEYGARKAWGLPVDVSVTATQMKTPLRDYTLTFSPTPQSLLQTGIMNIYALNFYYDMMSRSDWRIFLGGGLGWANFVGADASGVSASLFTGVRYHFQPNSYAVFKLKAMTVPNSKVSIQGQQFTLASQVMPSVNLGIGFDF